MTRIYEFVGCPGARLRDDHDGQPVVLQPGVGDNGAGETLSLTGDEIQTLVDAGVLRRQAPAVEDLVSALDAHIGEVPEGAVDALEQLCRTSPTVAHNVHAALTDEYP